MKIYQFQAKDSQLNLYLLYLVKISDVLLGNMKKTGLHVYVYHVLVDYDSANVDIVDIHKDLMKKLNAK